MRLYSLMIGIPTYFEHFVKRGCSQTNSLHISVGELSVSLWDLHILGGLPIFGKFNDEYIPCAAELTGEDELGKKFILKRCEYLFKAFHTIFTNDDKKESISIEDWIAFWYKGASSYVKPPQRKAKRYSHSKATWNPTRYILASLKSSRRKPKPFFVSLGINDDVVEQTYLAAFLSCWLCIFVLPSEEVNTIRPTTFKVASMMASGQEICLAIPVLTSIYKGLNNIANSSTLGRSESYFPTHYLYAWLAYIFGTHYLIPFSLAGPKMTEYSGEGAAKYFDGLAARILIHKGDSISWNSTSHFNNIKGLFIDKKVTENPQGLAYFINIRSSRLVLRIGDSSFVEPYSPYHFSRQFRYCQEIPNELERDEHSTTLEMAFRYWWISIQYKTNSKALFPSSPISFRRHTIASFQKWWEKVHDDYLIKEKDLLAQSTQPDSSKAKKGKGEEDETRQGIKPPAKDVKIMTGTSDKATNVKNIKTPVCRLGKPAMFHSAINKRDIPQGEEESNTSKEDCN
ncbi:hypothetical protein Acr_00g0070760 [Actinidia rufa]|uniref:Aminotransferase-like plant mobile domain-containing protein n=1 Tax=Actinidia rufa TaxID=165716 RepID=A0A7J0DRI5_9ERIC|nr:hypothetical protein Acr_00g0070760 [Actinidia rufa]